MFPVSTKEETKERRKWSWMLGTANLNKGCGHSPSPPCFVHLISSPWSARGIQVHVHDQPFVSSTTQVSVLDYDWSGTQQCGIDISSSHTLLYGAAHSMRNCLLLRRVRIPHSEATSNSWSALSWQSVVVLPVVQLVLLVVMSVDLPLAWSVVLPVVFLNVLPCVELRFLCRRNNDRKFEEKSDRKTNQS